MQVIHGWLDGRGTSLKCVIIVSKIDVVSRKMAGTGETEFCASELQR